MTAPRLVLALLLTVCFTAATVRENVTVLQRPEAGKTRQGDSKSVMATLMGDSQKLFADQFFTKADAYFHSGYYPSIFDHPSHQERSHMETASNEEEDHDHESHKKEGFLGKP